MGSVHSPFYLVFWAIALGNVLLVLTIGFWWLANRRTADFPQGFFAGWLIAMLVSLIAYLPSNQQYLAASVLILGDRPWQ
jgi:hypothetical protein